jgi:transcription initiation factor TFIID subunit TAF12
MGGLKTSVKSLMKFGKSRNKRKLQQLQQQQQQQEGEVDCDQTEPLINQNRSSSMSSLSSNDSASSVTQLIPQKRYVTANIIDSN